MFKDFDGGFMKSPMTREVLDSARTMKEIPNGWPFRPGPFLAGLGSEDSEQFIPVSPIRTTVQLRLFCSHAYFLISIYISGTVEGSLFYIIN